MYFETLYGVDPRGKSFNKGDFASLGDTEYYQPHVEIEFIDGKHVFLVREKHAFFDDPQKKLKDQRYTLNPELGFENEARLGLDNPSTRTVR